MRRIVPLVLVVVLSGGVSAAPASAHTAEVLVELPEGPEDHGDEHGGGEHDGDKQDGDQHDGDKHDGDEDGDRGDEGKGPDKSGVTGPAE